MTDFPTQEEQNLLTNRCYLIKHGVEFGAAMQMDPVKVWFMCLAMKNAIQYGFDTRADYPGRPRKEDADAEAVSNGLATGGDL
jgi:hypothetical protein